MNSKQSSYDAQPSIKLSNTTERYSYIHYCYTRETVQYLDKLMVSEGIVDNSYQLMNQAAQAVLNFINRKYNQISHITILCGVGNNAGDGYVLARLAKLQEKEPKLKVKVIALMDPKKLKGDAHQAYIDWIDNGGDIQTMEDAHFPATDLIIDAVIGTGLDRPIEGELSNAIALVNGSNKPILAVDIPSGLDANTGATHGCAIMATQTVTFIGQKLGMYTAQARHYCGHISFASLGVPDALYQKVEHNAILLEWARLVHKLPYRSPISHKGDHGHLLVIGGDYGMAGACRIAGEAALRTGTGLVSIATRKDNTNAITSARPELMVHGVESTKDLEPLLTRATAIAIGPGLGTKQWAQELLDKVINHITKHKEINCVIDADAINIMAKYNLNFKKPQLIYTPHFGEACRLLKYTSECPSENTNRFDMIQTLHQTFHGIFVFKGAGTLINLDEDIGICPYGNEGMASGGMGDCLTGIIGSLLAQGLSVIDAAQVGVCLHAKAGDLVAQEGKIGMIVSDLFPKIRQLINEEL